MDARATYKADARENRIIDLFAMDVLTRRAPLTRLSCMFLGIQYLQTMHPLLIAWLLSVLTLLSSVQNSTSIMSAVRKDTYYLPIQD